MNTDIYDMILLSFAPAETQRSAAVKLRQKQQPPSLMISGIVRTPAVIAAKYGGDPSAAAESIIRACGRSGYDIVPFTSERYPPLLREIYDPPIVLYTRGVIPLKPFISVVGTRKADTGSENITRRIARECAERGLCITSGMAMGIDRHAHMGALDARGSTAGVLPNGIDCSYPASNRDLFHLIEISPQSALISEYPPGCGADTWTFVRRNRIISGMSPVCVIIKAGIKSGAMITARFAVEQNREIFACGGFPFDAEYGGCQKLISDGAHILRGTDDIFSAYDALNEPRLFAEKSDVLALPDSGFSADSPEGKILAFLKKGPADIDTITRQTAITPGTVRPAIICLEISGLITQHGATVCLKGVFL